jgi:hypothetical protein
MRFPRNSSKQPVQKCDSDFSADPVKALTTAGDKPLLLSQIIVFQADRRSAGHPCTYANMQYTALNRWKKILRF